MAIRQQKIAIIDDLLNDESFEHGGTCHAVANNARQLGGSGGLHTLATNYVTCCFVALFNEPHPTLRQTACCMPPCLFLK